MMNKRIILSVIVIVVALIAVIWFLSSRGSTNNEPVVNQTSAQAKVAKNFDLSKSFEVFSNSDGKLQYQANTKTFILQLNKTITDPAYNTQKAGGVETQAAEKLKLTVEESCLLPLQIVNYKNESITSALCSGEE